MGREREWGRGGAEEKKVGDQSNLRHEGVLYCQNSELYTTAARPASPGSPRAKLVSILLSSFPTRIPGRIFSRGAVTKSSLSRVALERRLRDAPLTQRRRERATATTTGPAPPRERHGRPIDRSIATMLAWMGGVKRRIEKKRTLSHRGGRRGARPAKLGLEKAKEEDVGGDAAKGSAETGAVRTKEAAAAVSTIASLRSLDTSFLLGLIPQQVSEGFPLFSLFCISLGIGLTSLFLSIFSLLAGRGRGGKGVILN